MTPLHHLISAAALAAQGSTVGQGRIQGGWEYVWASYGITWAVLALYGLSLYLRWPRRHTGDLR